MSLTEKKKELNSETAHSFYSKSKITVPVKGKTASD
jgi:hypothetical protein